MNMFDYIKKFVEKFSFKLDKSTPIEKIDFAVRGLILEEVNELLDALDNKDSEEFIDALGDISWLCNKLLIQLDVNPHLVYKEIGEANLSKERGIKPGREQSGGFDVIKPDGWKGPDHSNNHGILDEIFNS